MSEESYKQRVFDILRPHFEIHTEVTGKHFSGKSLRIDAIVTPKANVEWKNKSVAMGIEFKDDLRMRGDTTNYTRWLAQCVDYASTYWDKYGYMFLSMKKRVSRS